MMRISFDGKEPDGAILISADGLDAEGKVSAEDYYQDGGSVRVRLGVRTVRLVYAVPESEDAVRKSLYEVYEFRKSGPLAVRTDGEIWTLTGEVSGIEGSRWARKETVEVTITCADPWLYGTPISMTGSGGTWTAFNPGEETGFTASGLSASGTITTASGSASWNVSDTVSNLTLRTDEGHRDLFDAGTGESYIEDMDPIGFPTLAHGETEVVITGSAQSVTFIPRRSGL